MMSHSSRYDARASSYEGLCWGGWPVLTPPTFTMVIEQLFPARQPILLEAQLIPSLRS